MGGRSIATVLLALACATPAARAWGPRDHRRIVSLAIPHVPPGLRAFLEAHSGEVLRGAVDPDRRFMDSAHHAYDVDDGTLANPDHVAYLASALVAMIRNGAPRERAAYWFGALSHYVSDIDQPLHTSDRDRREHLYHLLFEGLDYGVEAHAQVLGLPLDIKIGRALSGWTFAFDGKLDAIADVREWQVRNALWANRYYDAISRIYGKEEAYDARKLAAIYRASIDEAIDDVIDLWAHVYRSAGVERIALPPEDGVLRIDMDRKGRARVDGKRTKEARLPEAIRRYAAARAADPARPDPSVYVEVDDRCGPRPVGRLRDLCARAGIRRVAVIRVRKGPWTSRLARAVRVHAAALRR